MFVAEVATIHTEGKVSPHIIYILSYIVFHILLLFWTATMCGVNLLLRV